MSKGPERRFIDAIHRRLDPSIYRQGMGGTAMNGTPDYYYEKLNGALWAEYKAATFRRPLDLTNQKQSPCLSPLQQKWLRRAYANKKPGVVIVGNPDRKAGIVLTGLQWERVIENPQLEPYDVLIKRMEALMT